MRRCVSAMTHYIWLFAIVVALGLGACQGNGESEVQPEQSSNVVDGASADHERGMNVNRIAFVGARADLFTIDPDGNGLRRLTGGVQAGTGGAGSIQARPLSIATYYAWPTWSPDGTRIAVSSLDESDNRTQAAIQLIDTDTARAKTMYRNQSRSLVARGAPHYLYWSPDSRYLSFIASTDAGLTLFVGDSASSEEPVVVWGGAPLYFHWAADSNSLLIHTSTEVRLARAPFVDAPQVLLSTTTLFRAPALSPDGGRFAYIQAGPDESGLFAAAVDEPSDAIKLADVGALSAFAWSPDGLELAVADQQDETSPLFEQLVVVSADGQNTRIISDGPILAFYWSPVGDKITWVALNEESRNLEWMVADSTGEGNKKLFRFQPSLDVFTMLSFFDQYAYSHTPWSPDGTQLVVAGTMEPVSGSSNGQTPAGDRVYVLEATGTPAPRDIAAGTLAFWSWN